MKAVASLTEALAQSAPALAINVLFGFDTKCLHHVGNPCGLPNREVRELGANLRNGSPGVLGSTNSPIIPHCLGAKSQQKPSDCILIGLRKCVPLFRPHENSARRFKHHVPWVSRFLSRCGGREGDNGCGKKKVLHFNTALSFRCSSIESLNIGPLARVFNGRLAGLLTAALFLSVPANAAKVIHINKLTNGSDFLSRKPRSACDSPLFYRQLKGLIAGLLFSAIATQAFAQNNCGPRELIVKGLASKFGERPIWVGVQDPETILEIWASDAKGTYTALLSNPEGISCIASSGAGWFARIAPPEIKGAPL